MNCDTWPIPTAGCVNGCTIPDGTDPELIGSMSVQAGIILRTLSGGRAGTCEDTVRPLSDCVTCRGACRCSDAGDRLHIVSDHGPVTAVTAVNDGGTLVDDDEYRFYPSSQLLYRTPPDTWPRRDLKWAECGDADTFCVDVVIGFEPDAWALAVHAELTCELIKACVDPGACRLPTRAASVSGQGVTINLSPEQIEQFIPAVSRWVAAVNPDKAQGLPRLFSPDTGDCHGR